MKLNDTAYGKAASFSSSTVEEREEGKGKVVTLRFINGPFPFGSTSLPRCSEKAMAAVDVVF